MARRPSGDQFTVNYAYSACRGPIRHRWDLVVASMDQRPTFGTLALFRCETCGTERHDIFSRTTGELIQRWYDYPDGYSLVDAPTSSDFRRHWASTHHEELLDAPDVVTPMRRRRRA